MHHSTLTTESMPRSYRTETPSEPSERDDLPSVRTGGAAETCGAGYDTKKWKSDPHKHLYIQKRPAP